MYLTRTGIPVEIPFEVHLPEGVDPFNDVDVDVEFVDADGATVVVPAFWAGDRSFRVRFASSRPGRFEYRVRSPYTPEPGSAMDAGTVTSGTVEVLPYTGSNPLYAHGRVMIAPGGRHFQHLDGTPFLWLGDTQWQAFTSRLDWPFGFANLEDDRVTKGFSVVQVVAGPLPDFDADEAWHAHQANEAGWPWEHDWRRIDPSFYDLVDLKIAGLVERGLLPCIVGMWGFWLNLMGIDRVRKHWRYLVARYGAYPVTWCLGGEIQMAVYQVQRAGGDRLREHVVGQAEGWTDIAAYVRDIDPYRNLVTAHPAAVGVQPVPSRDADGVRLKSLSGSGRSVLVSDSALDFDMLQVGHHGFQLLGTTVELVRAAVAQEPPMPVVNGEVNYEGIAGSCWQDMQRFQFWTCMLDGGAGYTYGAAGLWAFWSLHTFSKGGESENVEDAGGGPWQEVMHLPGSEQVGIGKRFLERYPWWSFRPIQEPAVEALGRPTSFATGIPGSIAIYYAPSGLEPEHLLGILHGGERVHFWWRTLLPIQVDPTGRFEAAWFDPRTGQDIVIGPVEPDADGSWQPPAKPTIHDWVLVVVDHERLARATS